MIFLNKLLINLKNKKVALKFISSSFLSLPVSLIVSFITFRNIDPYLMGIWQTMLIFETYAGILKLGVVNGMNRELPFHLGMGKNDEARSFAETTLFYSLGNIILLWIIVPIIITNFEFNSVYFACLSVALIRVSLSFYGSYLSGTFRSNDQFNNLSNIQFAVLISKLMFSPLILLGLNGFLMMELLIVLVNAVLLHHYRPFHIKPRFSKQAYLLLLKTGFPLFLTSYAVSFIETLPRLYIIKFGSETLLGLYAPAAMVISTFSLLPSALTTYYYPKFSYAFGKYNNAKYLWKGLLKIYLFTTLVLLPGILILYFVVDDIIKIFPKYLQSLPYIKIALFTGPFVLYKLGNLVNVVLKNVSYMGVYVVLFAVFQFSFLFIFHLFFPGDVLYIAIWSQVLTAIALFFSSLIINHRVIRLST